MSFLRRLGNALAWWCTVLLCMVAAMLAGGMLALFVLGHLP